ncbi:MAG: hypothetical protein ACLQPD_08990 [Desulfomonilaceae bacterium]
MKTTSQSGETGSSDCQKCLQNQEIIDELNMEIARLRENEQINKETLQATSGLLHAIPTGLLIFQYQPPGELFYFGGNPKGHKMLGITAERNRGLELDELWPNARRQGLTEALLNTAKTGATFETEKVHFQKADAQKAFSLRALRVAETLLVIALDDISYRIFPDGTSTLQEYSEMTVELADDHTFVKDFVAPTQIQTLEHSVEITAYEPTKDGSAAPTPVGELKDLLNNMDHVARRALARLEAGYLSTAGASVEQVLQDLQRAAHIVEQLR